MNNLVGISIEQAEKELIRNTLKMVNGNREQAAKILGIGERTLYRKIKEYGICGDAHVGVIIATPGLGNVHSTGFESIRRTPASATATTSTASKPAGS